MTHCIPFFQTPFRVDSLSRTMAKPDEHTREPVPGRPMEGTSRIIDVTLSLVILLLTLPFTLLLCLLIKLSSDGPVIYRQIRVGENGCHFVLFKFRSMGADAERESGPCWARPRDSRVTRVGKFMRLARLDEIPQLLNVLRGEMNLVGPRPERPHFVDQFTGVLPRYQDRHFVKPGITGLAQICYPYGSSEYDARIKLYYDLHYIGRQSLFLDAYILLATIPIVLFGKGAC